MEPTFQYMFKVKNGLSPLFMNDAFSFSASTMGTRSGAKFVRPNINTVKKGEYSLRNYGRVVWNDMLPEKFKLSFDLVEFKTSIKKWTHTNCPCKLCKEYVHGIGYV